MHSPRAVNGGNCFLLNAFPSVMLHSKIYLRRRSFSSKTEAVGVCTGAREGHGPTEFVASP